MIFTFIHDNEEHNIDFNEDNINNFKEIISTVFNIQPWNFIKIKFNNIEYDDFIFIFSENFTEYSIITIITINTFQLLKNLSMNKILKWKICHLNNNYNKKYINICGSVESNNNKYYIDFIININNDIDNILNLINECWSCFKKYDNLCSLRIIKTISFDSITTIKKYINNNYHDDNIHDNYDNVDDDDNDEDNDISSIINSCNVCGIYELTLNENDIIKINSLIEE